MLGVFPTPVLVDTTRAWVILTSMARKNKKLSDQIREAMTSSSVTRYRLSKLTGIDQTALMRFERGEVGLLLDNIDKLADVLGLGITKTHAGSAAAGGAKRGRK